MSRSSNCLFITFNILGFIFGCVAIGSYIYLQINGVTDCKNVVQMPLIVIGIVLIVISIIGLVAAFWKLSYLLWVYSFVTVLALVGVTAFSVVMYMVQSPNSSQNLSIFGFKKHNIGEHDSWLTNMVEHRNQWSKIRTCLVDNQVCKRISNDNLLHDASDFLVKHLSPTEYGCCKPPIECGYEYKNGTSWIIPKSGPRIKDSDCTSWSNNKKKLCYDCNSCKAGVLNESSTTWLVFAILDLFDIAILLTMYTLSCCTRFHILSDSKYYQI